MIVVTLKNHQKQSFERTNREFKSNDRFLASNLIPPPPPLRFPSNQKLFRKEEKKVSTATTTLETIYFNFFIESFFKVLKSSSVYEVKNVHYILSRGGRRTGVRATRGVRPWRDKHANSLR